MSPAVANSHLMKMRSCIAPWCDMPVHQNLVLQGSLLAFCVPLTFMVELCLPSLQSSAIAHGLFWAGLVPVLFMGHSGAAFSLS